jgi:hypothetical protein
MKLRTVIYGLVFVVLAGCAHLREHEAHAQRGPVDITRPQVNVVKGKIVIDQETIVFGKGLPKGAINITWELPKGSKYRFPKDGIVFVDDAGEFARCGPVMNGAHYMCVNQRTKAGRFKYNIKVEPRDSSVPPVPPLDPIAVNDF